MSMSRATRGGWKSKKAPSRGLGVMKGGGCRCKSAVTSGWNSLGIELYGILTLQGLRFKRRTLWHLLVWG
jgi:hypothetical protein